jgi:ubiquinone/menaquinone biosynthesis C-methylase UbiE
MPSPFDAVATKYDLEFTTSLIGTIQRDITHQLLKPELSRGRKLRILEINCGTGEDACWMASLGHDVIATDLSSEMVKVGERKAESKKDLIDKAGGNIQFQVVGFQQLSELISKGPFDLIWSNFGGLNCVNKTALEQVAADLGKLLKSDGSLRVVLMARACLWENLFFRWKGDRKAALRRSQVVEANLGEGAAQQTWYYSSNELEDVFSKFSLVDKKPVGLFVAPSYLEKWWQSHPVLGSMLVGLDKIFGSLSFFADYADHIYLSFKKKNERE